MRLNQKISAVKSQLCLSVSIFTRTKGINSCLALRKALNSQINQKKASVCQGTLRFYSEGMEKGHMGR